MWVKTYRNTKLSLEFFSFSIDLSGTTPNCLNPFYYIPENFCLWSLDFWSYFVYGSQFGCQSLSESKPTCCHVSYILPTISDPPPCSIFLYLFLGSDDCSTFICIFFPCGLLNLNEFCCLAIPQFFPILLGLPGAAGSWARPQLCSKYRISECQNLQFI